MKSGRNWINRGATRAESASSLPLSRWLRFINISSVDRNSACQNCRDVIIILLSAIHTDVYRKYIGSIIIATMSENCDENVGLVAHSSSTSLHKFATTKERSDKQDKLHRRLLILLFGALERHSLNSRAPARESCLILASPPLLFFLFFRPFFRILDRWSHRVIRWDYLSTRGMDWTRKFLKKEKKKTGKRA